jgi:hypothetical protein
MNGTTSNKRNRNVLVAHLSALASFFGGGEKERVFPYLFSHPHTNNHPNKEFTKTISQKKIFTPPPHIHMEKNRQVCNLASTAVEGDIACLGKCPHLTDVNFWGCGKVFGDVGCFKACKELTSVQFVGCRQVRILSTSEPFSPLNSSVQPFSSFLFSSSSSSSFFICFVCVGGGGGCGPGPRCESGECSWGR